MKCCYMIKTSSCAISSCSTVLQIGKEKKKCSTQCHPYFAELAVNTPFLHLSINCHKAGNTSSFTEYNTSYNNRPKKSHKIKSSSARSKFVEKLKLSHNLQLTQPPNSISEYKTNLRAL